MCTYVRSCIGCTITNGCRTGREQVTGVQSCCICSDNRNCSVTIVCSGRITKCDSRTTGISIHRDIELIGRQVGKVRCLRIGIDCNGKTMCTYVGSCIGCTITNGCRTGREQVTGVQSCCICSDNRNCSVTIVCSGRITKCDSRTTGISIHRDIELIGRQVGKVRCLRIGIDCNGKTMCTTLEAASVAL